MTIQVYYCKLNTRFMIINLQHKKERLSYVSMRDYKALCVAVIKCQQHNLIWDKTKQIGGGVWYFGYLWESYRWGLILPS